MRKMYIYISIVLFIITSIASCKFERVEVEKDKNILYITHEALNYFDYWKVEISSNSCVELLSNGGVEYTYGNIDIENHIGEEAWKFKAVKSGEFTIFNLHYTEDGWLDPDSSNAEDYFVDENLEIRYIGNIRPIYENEKYDRILFQQYFDQAALHIDWELNDYPNVNYSATSDYDTRTINITVYGSNSDNESDLHMIIEDFLTKRFQNLDEVMHDITINIMFE
jgi:hypothetical protein